MSRTALLPWIFSSATSPAFPPTTCRVPSGHWKRPEPQIPVIHVILQLRPGHVDAHPRNKVLAAQDIDHLVLAGIATGGIVLSTALQAADLDYRVTVLSDACADRDPDLHHTLVTKVFNRRGDVLTTSEWAGTLTTRANPRP